jgi:hypothetical protein
LPEGGRVLWQGRPAWFTFSRDVLHIGWIAIYVSLLLAWCIFAGATTGGLNAALHAAVQFGGFAIFSMALLLGLGWGLARSTTYSITNSHLVIEYGMALPKTVTLPLSKVTGADYRPYPNGAGNISLSMMREPASSYMLMWPHVQPWHFRRPRPMLRAVPEGQKVAQILARVLAASADMAPVAVSQTLSRPAQSSHAALAA